MILITSPRAGFGKSHLVARALQDCASARVLIPISFDHEQPVNWGELFHQILSSFQPARNRNSSGQHVSQMSELSRFVFAFVNADLIRRNIIPCDDKVVALRNLEGSYLDIYEFGTAPGPVAQWFERSFDKLLPATSDALAVAASISKDRAAVWLRALLAHEQVGNAGPSMRLANLSSALATKGENPERQARENVLEFLRIGKVWKPVAIVLDHLDVFFRDSACGLKLADMASRVVEQSPGSLLLLCANDDV